MRAYDCFQIAIIDSPILCVVVGSRECDIGRSPTGQHVGRVDFAIEPMGDDLPPVHGRVRRYACARFSRRQALFESF